MINFEKVKLIIWDLDETLWEGTLSDNVSLKIRCEFIDFINDSLDRGIVHSICSKNDFEDTKEYLVSNGLWGLFVFPSIDWNPKGERIKDIIKDMNLRPENVLFVDDNTSNLHEANYYCPEMQVCNPQELASSTDAVFQIKKIDKTRPRLEQYRVLEKKVIQQSKFSSNKDFLMSCNIRVDFHNDCVENIDRIHDLIMRSNQLNYTKLRQEKEELLKDLKSADTKAAYVTVKDSFGDYGIVGFYMIAGGKVKHYLFSCRTLGMLVEQYVYMKIGCPEINIIGDVITQLNDTDLPEWINNYNISNYNTKTKKNMGNKKILFKGPCDISSIFTFIEETPEIKTDFTYINDKGISVEGHNHTSQLVTSIKATPDEKEKLINDTPWLDEKMLDPAIWYGNDVIIFSLLSDGNLGIYKHKESGWQIALCEKYYDITDEKNWENYINGKIFTSRIDFKKEDLISFAKKYEYINNSEGDVTLSNLDILYRNKDKNTKLVLMLGAEKPFTGSTKPSYENRHAFHKILNDKVKEWAKDKSDIYLIEINKYIASPTDYVDTINHFHKSVYYHMAQDLITIISDEQSQLKIKNKAFLYRSIIKNSVKQFVKKLLGRE